METKDGTRAVLYGSTPSPEVQSALASLVRLALDRARAAEESARMEAVQRGEEMRNTVLNALAHNFRTPLTSIKAAASTLRSDSPVNAEERGELVAVIDEEADRLHRLIRNSLDLVRIEAHRTEPRVEECNLGEMATKVSSDLKRYFGRRSLSLDIEPDLPLLRADRFLMEQMLLQVLDNAWKYSAPNARVWIAARRRDQGMILTVHNEGSQIPASERELIFGKFYRGASFEHVVQGTGLGLSIARSIAEAHGGSLWVEEGPRGPVFCFSMPCARDFERIDLVEEVDVQ
jgi:two-component system, OmpR family, sensor histidine kinase KdpD